MNGKVAKFLEETRRVDTSTFKVETRREMYMLRYKDEKRTTRELAEARGAKPGDDGARRESRAACQAKSSHNDTAQE